MKPPVFEEMPKFKAKVWDDNGTKPEEEHILYVYKSGRCRDTDGAVWDNYELIEEPKFRPFRDRDEFIQWLRDTGRIDMRVIDESGDMYTIIGVTEDCAFREIFKSKWFDNGEPVGVKE